MIGGFTYYEICLYFMEYSFFGWVLEVLYHAVTKGKIINRGFLNGPVCPIYGFGALGVLMLANGIDSANAEINDMTSSLNNLTLFIGGMIIATLIELFGGWLLDTLFHTRWWNYSDRRFNLKGYICPEFSILWGLAIMFCVRIVQPLMAHSTSAWLPDSIGWPILAVLYIALLNDLIVTVLTVRGLNKNLAELEKLREAMRKPSDVMTETIAQPAIVTTQKVDEQKVQNALAKAEISEKVSSVAGEVREKIAIQEAERTAYMDSLTKRRQQLLNNMMQKKEHVRGVRRIFAAFPQLEQHRYNDALNEVKEALKKKSK